MNEYSQKVGHLLRGWRMRRRLSQFNLAGEVGISTRHLSFIETGRAQPSRDMLLRLSQELDVPLRERNVLLVAGGFAPVFAHRPLDDEALQVVKRAVEMVLQGHEPYPALAIDRHWNLIAANRAVAPLLATADASLLEPPINVLRLSLHPHGLAPQIVNFAEWRAHLLDRLRRQCETTADPVLITLLEELRCFPTGRRDDTQHRDYGGIFVPLQMRVGPHVLAFFSTTTVFGTPLNITLAELAIEAFFPADKATTDALQRATSVE